MSTIKLNLLKLYSSTLSVQSCIEQARACEPREGLAAEKCVRERAFITRANNEWSRHFSLSLSLSLSLFLFPREPESPRALQSINPVT